MLLCPTSNIESGDIFDCCCEVLHLSGCLAQNALKINFVVRPSSGYGSEHQKFLNLYLCVHEQFKAMISLGAAFMPEYYSLYCSCDIKISPKTCTENCAVVSVDLGG